MPANPSVLIDPTNYRILNVPSDSKDFFSNLLRKWLFLSEMEQDPSKQKKHSQKGQQQETNAQTDAHKGGHNEEHSQKQ